MEAFHDVAGMIDFWGSLGDFARAAGVSYGAAKQMKRRRSVPVEYWPALTASPRGAEIGLDAERLMRLHAVKAAVPSETAEVAA